MIVGCVIGFVLAAILLVVIFLLFKQCRASSSSTQTQAQSANSSENGQQRVREPLLVSSAAVGSQPTSPPPPPPRQTLSNSKPSVANGFHGHLSFHPSPGPDTVDAAGERVGVTKSKRVGGENDDVPDEPSSPLPTETAASSSCCDKDAGTAAAPSATAECGTGKTIDDGVLTVNVSDEKSTVAGRSPCTTETDENEDSTVRGGL